MLCFCFSIVKGIKKKKASDKPNRMRKQRAMVFHGLLVAAEIKILATFPTRACHVKAVDKIRKMKHSGTSRNIPEHSEKSRYMDKNNKNFKKCMSKISLKILK